VGRLARRNFFEQRPRPSLQLAAAWPPNGFRAQVGGVITQLNLRLDFVVLTLMTGPAVLVSMPWRPSFAELIRILGMALTYVFYPKFAKDGRSQALENARRLLPEGGPADRGPARSALARVRLRYSCVLRIRLRFSGHSGRASSSWDSRSTEVAGVIKRLPVWSRASRDLTPSRWLPGWWQLSSSTSSHSPVRDGWCSYCLRHCLSDERARLVAFFWWLGRPIELFCGNRKDSRARRARTLDDAPAETNRRPPRGWTSGTIRWPGEPISSVGER